MARHGAAALRAVRSRAAPSPIKTKIKTFLYLQPKYIPADAMTRVMIMAKLTLINHFRSVHLE